MAVAFSMFDTTPAGLVAALKSAILASTDWSNPAGDRLVCTTTRGAAMVVDLSDAAATNVRMQLGVYRTTGLADKIIRYVQWRSSGGATSDALHCTVSAGKEHLFVTVEGPRAGEANAENAPDGSYRPVFFLCDLLPYFTADTVPAVVCGGNTNASTPASGSSYLVHVSRNAANTTSWVQGVLETLAPARGFPASTIRYGGNATSPSGPVVRPWVVFEDAAGMRGRLAQFFNLGWNVAGTLVGDFPGQMFSRITIGSGTYIGVPSSKSISGLSASGVSPFGWGYSGADGNYGSPVVAVPYS